MTAPELTLALRVAGQYWLSPDRHRELLDLLARHPEITEVALFTQWTFSPLPLAAVEERAEVLSRVLPEYRRLGLRAGINHLSTLGHLDEDSAGGLAGDFQRLVDWRGDAAATGYCLNDPAFQEHTRQVYRTLAATAPDFIWIDDDIRLEGHHPISYACFCAYCLEQFGAQTGRTWTRAELVEAFDDGGFDTRALWLEHNRSYVEDALALVRRSLDDVDPALPLGFMTSPLAYSGAGYERWATALGSGGKWRPGAGFYNDDTLPELLVKLHKIGEQVAPLGPEHADIQYELDNFPYHALNKSVTAAMAEIAGAIAVGCTGVALHPMGMSPDPFGENEPFFERLSSAAPFFSRLVEVFGRSPGVGVGITTLPDAYAARNPDGPWLSGQMWLSDSVPNEWSQIGIPFVYGEDGRQVTLLIGDSVLAHSDEQLRTLFSGGIALDGTALGHLEDRGMSHLTGFGTAGRRVADTLERYLEHPLNGEFAGWERDCRPSFGAQPTTIISPRDGRAVGLSSVHDYSGAEFGLASGVFENELGGRVAVLGYYPWTMTFSLAKSTQLKNLVSWLSGDALPLALASHTRAALWSRRLADGTHAHLVLNASLDAVMPTVEGAVERLRWMLPDGRAGEIVGVGASPLKRFDLPRLSAWEPILLY